MWKLHQCMMSLVSLKVPEGRTRACHRQLWAVGYTQICSLFCLVFLGNTALLGANLLFEMLCVLPGVKTL